VGGAAILRGSLPADCTESARPGSPSTGMGLLAVSSLPARGSVAARLPSVARCLPLAMVGRRSPALDDEARPAGDHPLDGGATGRATFPRGLRDRVPQLELPATWALVDVGWHLRLLRIVARATALTVRVTLRTWGPSCRMPPPSETTRRISSGAVTTTPESIVSVTESNASAISGVRRAEERHLPAAPCGFQEAVDRVVDDGGGGDVRDLASRETGRGLLLRAEQSRRLRHALPRQSRFMAASVSRL